MKLGLDQTQLPNYHALVHGSHELVCGRKVLDDDSQVLDEDDKQYGPQKFLQGMLHVLV